MIRIVIADDQELMRESLQIVLDLNEDMQVVGAASNGVELLELLEHQEADVILMDVRMPGMDGVQATKAVKNKYPEMKIIILTTFDDDEYVLNGLKYGASGYLLKGMSIPDLSAAIRKVVSGGAMLNTEIVTKVVKLFSNITAAGQPARPTIEEEEFAITVDAQGAKELTRMERNIVRLVGHGMSNREIAEKMNFSEGTVRNTVSLILSKLALRDRTQLAIWAVQTGLAKERLEL